MSVHPSIHREEQIPVSNRMDLTVPRLERNNTYRNTFQIIVVLAILIGIIFGILIIVYSSQQDSTLKSILDKINSAEEKTRNEYQKSIYDDCLDTIWENLRPTSSQNYLEPIRIKVFNTLRRLNPSYKRDLILFLYERELIRNDVPSNQLNLQGADLNNVQFENVNLDYLYLPGVNASNSLFSNCHLEKANFQGSIMDKSRFIACWLKESIFSGASLKESLFNDNVLVDVNFTNTDLLGSHINTNGFENKNILSNARLPSGSFYMTDPGKNLINDGGPTQQCESLQTHHWSSVSGYPYLTPIRGGDKSCIPMLTYDNNSCYYEAKSTGRLFQNIDLSRYSTFIDSNEAWCKISAYVGCSDNASSSDWSTVEVRFISKENIDKNNSTRAIQHGKSWELQSKNLSIPVGIRSVEIIIGANVIRSSTIPALCCAIGDIKVNIFQKKK